MSWRFIRAARRAEGLSAKAGNVLRVLAIRANEQGRSFCKQTTLAKDLGVSERTVRAALKELEAACWIVRERRFRADGTRTSDLITVRTLEEAAHAAAAQMQLPLMRLIEADRRQDLPVVSPVSSARDHRQDLPVDQPADPAAYTKHPPSIDRFKARGVPRSSGALALREGFEEDEG